MREIERLREIFLGLSSRDIALRLVDGEVTLRAGSGKAVSLPLKVIRGRGPDAVREASADAFNLFIDAGPRLTAALRDSPRRVKALGTSTGLLRLRLGSIFVDVERPIVFPPAVRRGPKLQGLSELVAEALIAHTKEQLPLLEKLKVICSGALGDGPSIAQIQKVLARLEAEQILSVDRTRGPRFTRYFDIQRSDLLRLWAREYMPSMTRSLGVSVYVTARDPDAVLAEVKRSKLGGRWVVGGPAAAQLWRPTLARSPRVELWVDDRAWESATKLGASVDDDVANLTVRRMAGGRQPLWFAHHKQKDGLPLVSPARAFVETVTRSGPRLDELADALLESIT